jgi:hypothetical protein
MVINIVHASKKEPKSLFQRFLHLLCWLKVIPVQGDSYKFSILSMPSFLATFWCWIPFTLFTFSYYCAFTDKVEESNATNITNASLNQTTYAASPSMDYYLYFIFMSMNLLLILLLPGTLGHFFSFNGPAMLKLTISWPPQGWIAVFSAIIFIAGETLEFLSYNKYKIVYLTELQVFVSVVVLILTAAFLQFAALTLIEARQTNFVRAAATKNSKTITVTTVLNLLDEYELIRQGLGPLFAVLFCIHTPVITCFSYFVFAHLGRLSSGLWITGPLVWSCLTLIQICLISDNCYDAVQA